MHLSIQHFAELNTLELYQILKLRAEVFIIEQQCIYADLDNLDQEAIHFSLYEGHLLVAYSRILPIYDGQSASFGRLVTHPQYRQQGLATQLMAAMLGYFNNHLPTKVIKITAQHYLQQFYERYDFVAQGEAFLMDGLPHILMLKPC